MLANSHYCAEIGMMDSPTTFKKEFCGKGWGNKMFVKAEYMPHRIRITNIRAERLQDISEEDCLKEGIKFDFLYDEKFPYFFTVQNKHKSRWNFRTAKEAFAALIDKTSGKGTWDKNPWVFVYEFELVK